MELTTRIPKALLPCALALLAGCTVMEIKKDSEESESIDQPHDPIAYPEARRTGNPNRVKSPYAPHNELDIAGLESGSLAMDPTTNKIFRVP